MGSGKSSIGRRMEKLGAGIIDCDKLGKWHDDTDGKWCDKNLVRSGHETYKVDTDVYRKIVETFGDDVVNPDDRSIQRKVLGGKVFQNPVELKKLTDIVWPGILALAQERIESLHREGTTKRKEVFG